MIIASLMSLAGPDMIIILLIVLVLFGAKRLPELAQGMGRAIREFQKAKDDLGQEIHFASEVRTNGDRSPISDSVPVAGPVASGSGAKSTV